MSVGSLVGIQKRSDNCFFNMVYLLALLFSATFRKKIEKLARDILIDPIRVVQGDIGEVSLSGADESQGVIFHTGNMDFFSHYWEKKLYTLTDEAPCFKFALKAQGLGAIGEICLAKY